MSATITNYDATHNLVTYTFTYQGHSYIRQITGVLTNGSYDPVATLALINRITSGPAFQADIDKLTASLGNGVLGSSWVTLPSVYRLQISGTGTISIDTLAWDGVTITTGVFSFAPTGTSQPVYPYFGDSAYAVRATLTGTAVCNLVG